MSQADAGYSGRQPQDPTGPFPLYQMVHFFSPGFSEVGIHSGPGHASMPVVWSVCLHHDYQNVITETSPREGF